MCNDEAVPRSADCPAASNLVDPTLTLTSGSISTISMRISVPGETRE